MFDTHRNWIKIDPLNSEQNKLFLNGKNSLKIPIKNNSNEKMFP